MKTPNEEFRSGFIGLAGVPNVGKSTLANRLVGQKVSITSRRAQTTRYRIGCVLTRPTFQAIFVDLPGILDSPKGFNSNLVQCAEGGLGGCDLIFHLRSARSVGSDDDEAVLRTLEQIGAPVWEVWNKIDTERPSKGLIEVAQAARFEKRFYISARTGKGVDELTRAMGRRLPPGPMLFPAEDISDRDLRFLCAELVREQAFLYLREETPYGVATWVEQWTERGDGKVFIRVIIQTDRESHKPIIIGAGGKMLKKIGSGARRSIESLCGQSVFLELLVRVKPKWRKSEQELQRLELSARRD